ncbi:hypothetical protein Aduo_019415 [Ancylostoma duodenale]
MLNYLQKSWWHLFLIGIAVYIALQYRSSSNRSATIPATEKSESRKTKDIKSAILKQKERVVGKFCDSSSPESCFDIVDRPFLEDDSLVVKRHLKLKNTPQVSITTVELETPQELTWKNFNTRQWPVNKLVLSSLYTRMMIAMGFITEALEFDPHQWQNVLIIGLGGGSMNNFLSAVDFIMVNLTTVELDHSMVELATDWFGLAESDTNQVVIEDGVVFVREAAKRGEKYKSILIDACYNDNQPIVCPVPELTKSDVIKNMAEILEDGGVLSVNVLCMRDSIGTEDVLLKTFEEHFPTCFLQRYSAIQRLLVCANKEKWSFMEQKDRFMENVRKVDDRFDFKISAVFSNYSSESLGFI